jgi:Tol biopolymer transport system component
VFLLSADGSRETPLIQHPADDVLLAWLPDGRGILFASDRAGTFDLWTVQLDKGQVQGAPTLVKRTLGPITPMGLTRMGAFYYRTPGSFMDVFTASFDPKTGSVAGSPKKEPLPFEGHNRMPDWSPDGKHLAYVSQRPGERKGVLCIYSADTGKVREYRPGKGFAYPRWAPDGQHLYLMAPSFEGRGIYRMDVQSGEVTPFLGAGADESVFSLRASADQKWIVYSQDGKTVDRLIRRNAESGQEHEIERARDLSNVALSPDGSRLAWILKPDEKTRVLKVMEFPDGTPREIQKLTMVDNWNFDLGWSPDGRFIYYFDRAPGTGEWRLRRVAAEGGEAQDLGLTSRYFEQLSVHPDGSRITYSGPPTTSEPPQVWVMENFLPRK